MHTTLNLIKNGKPCTSGYKRLLEHLGKTTADDEPLLLSTIIRSNGISDALWCLDSLDCFEPTAEFLRKVRLMAVFSARRVTHLMTDERSRKAVDAAHKYYDRSLYDLSILLERYLLDAREAVHNILQDDYNPSSTILPAAKVGVNICHFYSVSSINLVIPCVIEAMAKKSLGFRNLFSDGFGLEIQKARKTARDEFTKEFYDICKDVENADEL